MCLSYVNVSSCVTYIVLSVCVFLSQYLFPDAAVEKSSENNKNKTAQSNIAGKAEPDKNSDCVRLPFHHKYSGSQVTFQVSVKSVFKRGTVHETQWVRSTKGLCCFCGC